MGISVDDGSTISALEAKELIDSGKARLLGPSKIERVSSSELSAEEVERRGFRDNHPFPFGPWIQPTSPGFDQRVTPRMLREIHRKSSAVRPAVSFLVRTLSTTPWNIVAQPGVPKREFNFAVDLFTKPGPGAKTFRELLAKVLTDLFVLDAIFVEKIRSMGGGIVEFAPRDPATFKIHPGEDGDIKGYTQRKIKPDGTELKAVEFDSEDIMRTVFYPRTDSFMGTPVIEAIVDEVSALMFASQGIASFFDEDEIPTGVLHLGDIGKEAYLRARADFEAKGGMRSKRMLRTTFGRGEPRWIPFQRPFREMEIAQLMPRIERIVFRNFGVTPLDLGMSQDVNRCFSLDTQVLTRRGWKYFWEVGENELLGTVDPSSLELEYHPYDEKFVYDYDGDMINFTGRQQDVLVTPNHKMWVRSTNNSFNGVKTPGEDYLSRYEFVEAKELKDGGSPWAYPVSFLAREDEKVDWFTLPGALTGGGPKGHYPEREIPMDLWLEFLGYWISEGHAGVHSGHYHVSLSQKSGTECEGKMAVVMEDMPVTFNNYISASDDVRRWQVGDKALMLWLNENCGDYSKNKRLPDFVWSLPREQLEILYRALIDGDGHRSNRHENSRSVTYYTSSERLADDVQILASLLGHRALLREHKYKEPHSPGWRVLITEGQSETGFKPRNVEVVEYSGKVFCFDVPPHHLLITRRNGNISITGNSTAESFKEIRTFTLFKPILDLLAESFTFDILHEINPGLFLEFQHFSRTGEESDAEGLGTETNPVDTDVPGEEEGSLRSPLFGGYGLDKTGMSRIICRPHMLPGPKVRKFTPQSWSDQEIIQLLAGDDVQSLVQEATRSSNEVVETLLSEAAEEFYDMVKSRASDSEIRAQAEYVSDTIASQVNNNLRAVESKTHEYVSRVSGIVPKDTIADNLTNEYKRKLQEIVVNQISSTSIGADEEASMISAFDTNKLSVDNFVTRAAANCLRGVLVTSS